MKQKILNALKTKYKTFGFGDKAFDGVADYLSKTVTEEAQIETAIGGVEGLLKAFQGEVDVVRNEKSGLQKELEALKANQPKEEPTPPNQEQTPECVNTLLKANETLASRLDSFEQKEKLKTRSEQILSKAKEYGIPDSLVSRFNIAEDADLDVYMKEVKQEFVNIGLEGVLTPEVGGTPKKDSDEIANLINKGTENMVKQNQN
mgnify:CR=1 FL=1